MNVRCQHLEVIVFDRGFDISELAITWNAVFKVKNCHDKHFPTHVSMWRTNSNLVGQIHYTFLDSLTSLMSDNGRPTSNAYLEIWNGVRSEMGDQLPSTPNFTNVQD